MAKTKNCYLPMCENCSQVYWVMALVVVFMFSYYAFLRFTAGKNGDITIIDKMNTKVFEFPLLGNCCSWWPISHFILFFILGILFPDCGVLVLSLGVVWEIFETAADVYSNRRSMSEIVLFQPPSGSIEYSGSWWAGSIKDLIFNTLGFVCGWMIAKKLGMKQFL